TATVLNAPSSAVAWTASPNVGTLSSSGLYTAPPVIPFLLTVSITVASVADPSKSASLSVTLLPALTQTSPAGPGLRFVPVGPCRIADTRSPTGAFGGPALAGNIGRDFNVVASPCGVPSNAAAYSLNLTAIPRGPL